MISKERQAELRAKCEDSGHLLPEYAFEVLDALREAGEGEKLRLVVTEQQEEIERQKLAAVRVRTLAEDAADAWFWQDDHEDHLDSMADGMAVLMQARQLREFLRKAEARADQAEAERDNALAGIAATAAGEYDAMQRAEKAEADLEHMHEVHHMAEADVVRQCERADKAEAALKRSIESRTMAIHQRIEAEAERDASRAVAERMAVWIAKTRTEYYGKVTPAEVLAEYNAGEGGE